MTTITRKMRTVEYFEVDGHEYPTLNLARAASRAGICSWLQGSGLTMANSDMLAHYIAINWDQLKAIIEGVRVEETPVECVHRFGGDAFLENPACSKCGVSFDKVFMELAFPEGFGTTVADAPAASPESASAPRS